MSAIVDLELERFAEMVRRLGKQSHRTPQEYPKAVRMFMDLLDRGERFHPDDVKHAMIGHGWREADAHDLGQMADVVTHVYRALGRL